MAAAYDAKLRESGMSECGRAEAVGRYRAAREQLRVYEQELSGVTRNLPDAFQADRQRLFNLGLRAYGLRRSKSASEALAGVAEKGAELAAAGVSLRAVSEVAVWSLGTLGFEFDRTELEQTIKERAEWFGGSMNTTEVRSQDTGTTEVRSQKEEGRTQNEDGGEVGSRRLRAGSRSGAQGVLPESSLLREETALDRFRKRNAVTELRHALAGHQPLVKAVVVERLSRHTSFAQLAERHGLTLDEVRDILRQMRQWVKRFTQYYENDWHWAENAGKYHIPALPGAKA